MQALDAHHQRLASETEEIRAEVQRLTVTTSDVQGSAKDASAVVKLHRERQISKLQEQRAAMKKFLQKPEYVRYRANLKAQKEKEEVSGSESPRNVAASSLALQ